MKCHGAKWKNLIKSITYKKLNSELNSLHDSDNYDEKYMKIMFNSDDDLPLKKTLKL